MAMRPLEASSTDLAQASNTSVWAEEFEGQKCAYRRVYSAALATATLLAASTEAARALRANRCMCGVSVFLQGSAKEPSINKGPECLARCLPAAAETEGSTRWRAATRRLQCITRSTPNDSPGF